MNNFVLTKPLPLKMQLKVLQEVKRIQPLKHVGEHYFGVCQNAKIVISEFYHLDYDDEIALSEIPEYIPYIKLENAYPLMSIVAKMKMVNNVDKVRNSYWWPTTELEPRMVFIDFAIEDVEKRILNSCFFKRWISKHLNKK